MRNPWRASALRALGVLGALTLAAAACEVEVDDGAKQGARIDRPTLDVVFLAALTSALDGPDLEGHAEEISTKNFIDGVYTHLVADWAMPEEP